MRNLKKNELNVSVGLLYFLFLLILLFFLNRTPSFSSNLCCKVVLNPLSTTKTDCVQPCLFLLMDIMEKEINYLKLKEQKQCWTCLIFFFFFVQDSTLMRHTRQRRSVWIGPRYWASADRDGGQRVPEQPNWSQAAVIPSIKPVLNLRFEPYSTLKYVTGRRNCLLQHLGWSEKD